MRVLPYLFKILPMVSIVLLIMGGSDLCIGGYPLQPSLFLIPVFYWLVFRPDWIPLWGLFGIGIFYDALMNNILGLSALLLMVSAVANYHLRPLLTPQSFHLIWGSFCFYSLCYLGLYGILTGGRMPLFFSWIYGVIFYPLIAWALSQLHGKLQAHV
jgi:rod shape-determining protein MreD